MPDPVDPVLVHPLSYAGVLREGVLPVKPIIAGKSQSSALVEGLEVRPSHTVLGRSGFSQLKT